MRWRNPTRRVTSSAARPAVILHRVYKLKPLQE